jgi:PEP-CTERM/exosortase A-associated glycosyltransferase
MKILHVFDHSLPVQDGYSYRSMNILLIQRALGWETVHVTSAKHLSEESEENFAGLKFYRTQATKMFSSLPVLGQLEIVMSLRRRLSSIVAEEQPDIIHVHSPSLNGLAALGVAKKHRIPLVYEVRAFWEDAAVDQETCRQGDLRYRLTAFSESYVLRRAGAVTTICEGLRREMVKRGIPEEKITVIPNGVDVERYTFSKPSDAELARSLGLEGKLILGFIGSFYAYEGLDLLLEAFSRITASLPDARLLIVGGGLEEENLKRQARELSVEDRVVFTGRVPHDKVEQYYSLIDLACFPRHSLRLTETVTPLKPLEAMAMGRICVASDVGGHKELIEDGKTGFLFRTGDVQSLVDVVNRIASNRDDWNRIQVAGRQFIEKERTWAASVSRYVQVYNSVQAKSVRG